MYYICLTLYTYSMIITGYVCCDLNLLLVNQMTGFIDLKINYWMNKKSILQMTISKTTRCCIK